MLLLLLLPPLVVTLRLRHRSSTSMRVAIRRLLLPPLLVPPPLLPPMVPTQSMEFLPPPLLLLPTTMLEFFRFPRPLVVARAPSAGCRATGETRAAPSLLLVVVVGVVVGVVVVGIMVLVSFRSDYYCIHWMHEMCWNQYPKSIVGLWDPGAFLLARKSPHLCRQS